LNPHARHEEDVGAYLLEALPDAERQEFEGHLAECSICRDEVERLRLAAQALPRSVTPLQAPPRVKAGLMEVVEREAGVRPGAPARVPLRRRLGALVPRLGEMRPTLAWVSASFLLVVGLLTGFGVAKVLSGDDARTVTASADTARVPHASGTLSLPNGGEGGGILRVQGLPSPGGNRVYQAWVARDGHIVPQATFEVGRDGSGAAAVTEDLNHASAVMVTRERRGGARAPSEKPVLRVNL
jgi:Anti-sigma-K factor rskA/Putative zinc-finger